MKVMLKSVSTSLFLYLLFTLGTACSLFAQGETATGQVSGQASAGAYDYTITLNNTSSSVSIGSFWYAWTPTIAPFFYLPSDPTSALAPVGWTASPVANSIQFTAGSGVSLAPGQSIQFQYVAGFSPAQLTGMAGYSYVYSGGIEADPGAFLNVVTTVPEPSSAALLLAGFLGLTFAGRWKLKKSAAAS